MDVTRQEGLGGFYRYMYDHGADERSQNHSVSDFPSLLLVVGKCRLFPCLAWSMMAVSYDFGFGFR